MDNSLQIIDNTNDSIFKKIPKSVGRLKLASSITNILSFGRLFSQEHSYEDAHNLLETLLLVSALMLAFAVGGLQNLDHDNLLEADEQERYLAGRWVPGDFLSYRC